MSPQIRNTVLACVGFMLVMLAMFLNNAMREKLPTDDELLARGIVVIPRPRTSNPWSSRRPTARPSPTRTCGAVDLRLLRLHELPGHLPRLALAHGAGRAPARRARGRRQLPGRARERRSAARSPGRARRIRAFFSPTFRGVTGTHEDIVGLTTQVSVAFAAVPEPTAPDGYVVDHTGNIVMIDPRGQYVGYIRPPHTAEQIADAYEALAARD